MTPSWVRNAEGGASLALKVVPGATHDVIVGPLGDRLKIRVSAPPEAGKANAAICKLLAGALGVRVRDVSIVTGQSSTEKALHVRTLTPSEVVARLGDANDAIR